MTSATIWLLATCVLVFSLFHAAAAQDANRTATQHSDWNFTIGGGPMVTPNYEGSKHYLLQPLPMLETSWRDTISLSAVEGLKIVERPLADKGFSITGSLGYWLGRKEGVDKHHGDTLRGLGNLSGGGVGKLEMGYQYNAFSIGLGGARDIGNDRDGTTATLSAGYKIYQSQTFQLGSKISTTWADDNYMNNIFGITPAQARDSLKHYSPYKAEAGLKDVRLGLTANYGITRSLSLFAIADVAHLLGDAADSPIVKTQGAKEQISGGLGLVYHF